MPDSDLRRRRAYKRSVDRLRDPGHCREALVDVLVQCRPEELNRAERRLLAKVRHADARF